MAQLTRNRLKCRACGGVIESVHVHDFKYCGCGKIFVDGGREYCRFGYPGGDPKDHIEDLCEYRPENGQGEE